MTRSLVIIGGGFSGAAFAAHQLGVKPGLAVIDVIEPRDRLGHGIAYGDAGPSHILNVTADRMSLWNDQPMSFLEWAQIHGPNLGWPEASAAVAHSYLPRRLYGAYVEAELAKAIHASSTLFRHRRTRAASLARQDDGFRVQFDDGKWVDASTVVLATGYRAPGIPFPVSGAGARFISDPWVSNWTAAVGRHDRVLLIGTGLTMVDMVAALKAVGHSGPVTALSRHGFLPRIHGASALVPPLLSPQDAERGATHVLTRFRSAVSRGVSDWRSAIDALRPHTDTLWQSMPAVEQDRFMRHLRPLWEVHRHRMPAESADMLFERIGKGLLTVFAGRVNAIEVAPETVSVNVLRRGGNNVSQSTFDWVVNCTPPQAPLSGQLDLLYRSLLNSGLVRTHRSGLGLDVDADGRVLDASGTPVDGLYVLGPPRRGHSVEATAVPHIRPQLTTLLGLITRSEIAA